MRSLSAAASLAALAVAGQATAATPAPAALATTTGVVEVLQLRPNFYMLTVDGVNVGLATGPEGTVVVDTGPARASGALLDTIRRLSPQWIRFIVDTSADPDLIGGNAQLSGAGQSMMIGWQLLGRYQNRPDSITGHLLDTRAPIIARQGVLEQMVSDSGGTQPDELALPSATFALPQTHYNFRLNEDVINVVAMPPAHSDADSVVLFRRADVLVTGAIFDVTHFPVIDVTHGGSINGEIAAIDEVMDNLAVPSGPVVDSEDGTLIIPLHGAVCNQPELLTYRDMLYAVRSRVEDMIKHGRNLEQVEAADPTQGYERRFGSDTGPWTTKDFIEAVYRSLKTAAPRRERVSG